MWDFQKLRYRSLKSLAGSTKTSVYYGEPSITFATLIILRIQKERQTANLLPSLREYALYFGVNLERLRKAKQDVVIMHPGPMNRGVEIAQEVAEIQKVLHGAVSTPPAH